MPRIQIAEDYTLRQNEILDTAQVLIFSKGYESMTIQDILNTLHISKGAFYHYFPSKQVLLEAIIDRMQAEANQFLIPIVEDPNLLAIEKLNLFFISAAQWKTNQKEYLLALLNGWYSDDNALVRQKLLTNSITQTTQMLDKIILQGIHEGCIHSSFPGQISHLVMSILIDLSDSVGKLLLARSPQPINPLQVENIILAYTDAIERVLGIPSGQLKIFDFELMKQWF